VFYYKYFNASLGGAKGSRSYARGKSPNGEVEYTNDRQSAVKFDSLKDAEQYVAGEKRSHEFPAFEVQVDGLEALANA
jgi:hypothetical protein